LAVRRRQAATGLVKTAKADQIKRVGESIVPALTAIPA